MILATYEYQGDFDRWFKGSLRSLGEQLYKVPPESRSLAKVIDSLYRYHGESVSATFERWGDKTPLNSLHLDDILAVFPDARFVHLMRDPVDTIHSFLKANLLPDLEAVTNRWLKRVDAVHDFQKRNSSIVCEIRYEDLVHKTVLTLKTICRFISIEFVPSMINSNECKTQLADLVGLDHLCNVFEPITVNRIGKGRQAFSNAEKQYLHRIIGHYLERLGYDPVI